MIVPPSFALFHVSDPFSVCCQNPDSMVLTFIIRQGGSSVCEYAAGSLNSVFFHFFVQQKERNVPPLLPVFILSLQLFFAAYFLPPKRLPSPPNLSRLILALIPSMIACCCSGGILSHGNQFSKMFNSKMVILTSSETNNHSNNVDFVTKIIHLRSE